MKREISTSQREIQDAETVLCGGCVALCRIISDGSAEGGKFKVSGLKFKVAPLKTVAHCAVVARKLGWRAADCGFSGGFARPAILHPLSSIIAFGGRAAARPYRVFHLVSACFTWFQLSGKKEEASVRSEIPSWQRVQPFVKHQIPTSKRQRTFKCQSPNDLLANVRIGLGTWELVLPWSLDVGRLELRGIPCHFGAFLFHIWFQWSQAFHLVSPGCTYTTLEDDKPRYF